MEPRRDLTEVKLNMYRGFGGKREFKKYLHDRSDEGARLLCRFRSGTYGLNKELGRHSDRHGRVECTLCGAECVMCCVSVLLIALVRANFQEVLKQLIGARNSKALVL